MAIALALASTVASGGLDISTAPGAAAASSAPTKLVVIDLASGVPVISTTTVAANQAGTTEANLETRSAVTAFPDVDATPQSVGTDGDPLRSAQWALDELHVDGAHREGYDGTGQTVAVIDTGVYVPHEDLDGQIVESVDMLDGLPGFRYHGTAVAGIIAADSGNGIGVEGISPGAKLLDIRVCTPTMCPSDAILNGIVWAVQHHATVINMSLGGGSPEWSPVLSWAQSQGVVIVAAAGNAGCQLNSWNGSSYVPNQYCTAAYVDNAREWPAADPHVIAVGAMQQDGTVAAYSSYGTYLDLAAPTGVVTTTPPYYDSGFSGTSAAAPHVAAVAALVRQADPELSPSDVQAVLEDSAVTPAQTPQHAIWTPDLSETDTTTINPQMLVGAGVVDAQAAVDLARTWSARTAAPVATPGDGQLALAWPAIDGAASYRVRVNNAVVATTAATSFIATGLDNHGGYVVDVDALDGNGALVSASKPVLATPDDAPTLAPIHLTQVYNDGYSGDLVVRSDTAWVGNRILNLYRTDQPGLAVASTTGMSNSFVELFGYHQTDPTVTYYATWSDLDNHESPASNAITVNAFTKPLPAPANLHAAAGDGSVMLSWDAVSGAAAYMYYDFPTNTWTTTTATSVVETGLTDGRPYSGNVYAKLYDDGNTNAVDSFASELFQFMPLPPAPAAPTLTITTSNTGITVAWSAVPGATGYNVYRDDGFSFGTFPGQTSQFLAYGPYTTAGHVYHFVAQPYIYFDTWGFTEFGAMSDAAVGGTTTTTTTSTSTSTSTTTSTPTSTSTSTTVPSTSTTTTAPPSTTSTSVPRSTTTTTVAPSPRPRPRNGYRLLSADGRVAAFGDARRLADAHAAVSRIAHDAAVHLESTPTGNGYWILDRQGRVFAFGDARNRGGLPVRTLAARESATTIRRTPTGRGYWIVTTLGRVFGFGDAHRYGNAPARLNAGIVDAIATPSGRGYWLFGADGGVFAYGDAPFRGSAAGHTGGQSIVGAVASPDGRGYLLVNRAGRVFAFGDAPNRGSVARAPRRITAVTTDGNGYAMADGYGVVYVFPNRPSAGSRAGRPPVAPIISIAAL